VLTKLIEEPELKQQTVESIMEASFPFVAYDTTVDVLTKMINQNTQALLTRDEKEQVHIITQADLLASLGN
jgi:cystathionine beta-synthase